MRKILSIIIAAMMAVGGLCACGSGGAGLSADNDKIQIVTTIFPEYDWVKSILGDNPADVQVTMLLDNGVDLHSYQPSTDDILSHARPLIAVPAERRRRLTPVASRYSSFLIS